MVKKSEIRKGLDLLKKKFGEQAVETAVRAVENWKLELPTWSFGSFGGGRFSGYTPPAAARTIEEKLDDIAFIHTLTSAVKAVATHVLWDFSADGLTVDFSLVKHVALEAKSRRLKLGCVSPTYFLKGFHQGSFTAFCESTRRKAVEQTKLAAKIARQVGSGVLTLWFPDGSLYPGQIQLRQAYERMRATLLESLAGIIKEMVVLIEYKVFEPGTYSTVIPDWGTAFLLARHLGPGAGVLVDLGHHHHTTNVEQIVAVLLSEKIPLGFHFNTRYAADDDQAVEPNPQLARIFYELVNSKEEGNFPQGCLFMLDQACSRENRMAAVLHSIDSLQTALARACLVDTARLHRLQREDDIIGANRLFNEALMQADVSPILHLVRRNKGLPADPVAAYMSSGYRKKIEGTRC